MDGEEHIPLESINTGGHATRNPINGHANGVHINGQATENQLNGQATGDLINGQANGVHMNGLANGVHMNGLANGAQANGQATGNQLNGQANGDQIMDKQATVTIWSIDWGQLIRELRKNWTLKRSWQKILLLLIVFSGIVYDMVSDGLVANYFLNGQNYIKSVENQSDLAVTGSECSLISHTITNFTLDDRISESFRYVYFSKSFILIQMNYQHYLIFGNN